MTSPMDNPMADLDQVMLDELQEIRREARERTDDEDRISTLGVAADPQQDQDR